MARPLYWKALTLAAVLLGAPVFWVNLFAALFVVVRVAMAVVHIGTTNQPMRSLFFMLGLVCILALAVLAIFAAF